MTKQQLSKQLQQIKEISHTELLYYARDGRKKMSTCGEEGPQKEDILDFLEGNADCQKQEGIRYFRLEKDGQCLGALLMIFEDEKAQTEKEGALSSDADACMNTIGRLAAAQFVLALSDGKASMDRATFFAGLLKQELSMEEIDRLSAKLRINKESGRVVYLIETEQPYDKNLRQLLVSLYPEAAQNYLIPMDEKRLILLMEAADEKAEALRETAETLVDMLNMEAMCNAVAAYSRVVKDIKKLGDALEEAKTALEVGRIFDNDSRVYDYSSLGVGRLLYQLPKPICELYLEEVFGEELPAVFDEEMLHLVETFFENNLNISEAARQLYIHRNTLINRLDRIEKETGLDLKRFSDAMRLELALLVKAYLQSEK